MIAYIDQLRRMRKIHRLTESSLNALQNRRLRAVIRNAYDHVPYYRNLFKSVGLSSDDIRTVDDLRKIPVTTKDDLKAAGVRDTVADWVDLSKCIRRTTHGTTGKHLDLYRTWKEQRTVLLLNLTAQMSVGYRPQDVLGVLGPELPFVPRFYHRIGLLRKDIIPLSLPVKVQIERLRKLQPTVIWAYPSALRALIHRLEIPMRELVRPRIIIHSAEVLDRVLRRRLAEDSDAECFNFYLAQEFGLIAWECLTHEGLHLNSDHSVLECLHDGTPATPGKTGSAVLTSLYANAMPFIRYEIGDLIAFLPKKCSCGCPLPLIDHPIGRQDDMVVLASGRTLAPMRFAYILEKFPSIDQWRVLQVRQDSFVLQLVLRDELTSEMSRTIRAEFLEYLGEPATLDIQVTDFIEEEAYKFRSFVATY
ncbi:MAG: hypothetical protein P8182_02165 [Deltaproteobacteria bacterium]